MKVAMPIAGDRLCAHFGHCQQFYFFDFDENTREVLKKDTLIAPPHEPGLLPRLLKEKGVNLVIAGGMGMQAQKLFTQNGIKVVTGAGAENDPVDIIKAYFNDTLKTGANLCDH